MIRTKRMNQCFFCIFLFFVAPGMAYGEQKPACPEYIRKVIIKETKCEHERNVRTAMRFANVQGDRLGDVVTLERIEKIYIPYGTEINADQVFYLLQNAVFGKYGDMPPAHLLPADNFQIVLKNYSILDFQLFAGASMIRVTSGTDEFWLAIPGYEKFRTLGKKEEIR